VCIPAIDRRAPQAERLLEQPLHGGTLGRFDFESQVRGFTVRSAHTKLFHFESAAEFDYLIEDLLHDVGIDQVALGLDNFLKLHECLF
jgi:hypothetical protein